MLGLMLGAMRPGLARAATYYVDNSLSTCNNNGPGTELQPYCTILAALIRRGGPGTTVVVKTGTYREQVNVPASGTPDAPFVITALGTVTVDGADAFYSPAQWTPYIGDVWLASGVNWTPLQVFADGARLTPLSGVPSQLSPNTFTYVPGEGLYVHAGGGNPGDHGTLVGRRYNGFHLTGASWVTIEGFTVVRSDEKGFDLEAGSDNCVIRNNDVSGCGSSGISLLACSNNVIEGNRVVSNAHHGIELRDGSSANHIQDNVSARNRGTGVATGIYLAGSARNVIQRNRVYDNEDSGIEIQSGSDNCVSAQNLSYLNGDHGFEHLFASGTTNAGNVAWQNHTDGFSIEGTALGTILYDCIGVNNGLGINQFDLYVDPGSTAGLTSDYNIFWNSTSQNPIKYNGVQYSTVAALAAASGTDGLSLQMDPLFIDPSNGDFNLLAGSPAIDSGLSGFQFWPGLDAQGFPRKDDPATANTGAGPIDFADRGALEYHISTTGVGDSPVAGIVLSGAFPNPAGGTVSFALSLPRAARVDWGIFDIQGRKLGGGEAWRPAGRSVVSWNAAPGAHSTSSGVRFAKITVDGQAFTRRFVALH